MIERTLCLIKPRVVGKPWIVKRVPPVVEGEEPGEAVEETLSTDISDAIRERFISEGFTVVQYKRLCINQEQARQLFINKALERTYDEVTDYLTSGQVVALVLEKEGAVASALAVAGNADPLLAKQETSGDVKTWSLRAQFGIDEIKNAVHVSASTYDALHEETTLFPPTPIYQRTIAIIKNDAVASDKSEEIIKIIEQNDFVIVAQTSLTLTQEKAEELYSNNKDSENYNDIIEAACSGPIIALAIEKMNAVTSWKILMGPASNANVLAPTSIRGKLAISDTKNAVDGSENISFFFPTALPVERTLAMIKPGTADKHASEIKASIEAHGFTILAEEKVRLTKSRSGEFYGEHKGKSFYEPLTAYMASGNIYALVLAKPGAIKSWRTLCGPTNSAVARKTKPNSLRSRFGLDGRQNAVHGSDSVASAEREIAFHFPQLHHPLLSVDDAKVFLSEKYASAAGGNPGDKTLNQVLVEGLSELCRVKPTKTEAIKWLGQWLIEHNVNKPGFKLEGAPVTATPKTNDSLYKNFPNQGAELVAPHEVAPRFVFVLGGPGSGKGTQCSFISKEFGYTHISTGDILREEIENPNSAYNAEIKEILAKGGLVSNEIVMKLLKKKIKSSENNKFLIDGYPREIQQAFLFEKEIGPVSFVVYYDVPDNVMVERCVARGASSGRSDDNKETTLRRIELFKRSSSQVIDFYSKVAKVRQVNANAPVEEVLATTRGLFRPEIIFAPGGPGSGTSTICKKISKEYGYTHVSVGDVLREEVARGSVDGVLIGKLQKDGRLIPAALTQKLLKKALFKSSGSKFILDGFPKTFKQAALFEEEIGPCKFLLSLETSISIMMERCTKRNREDDSEDAARQRLSVFKVQTEPLIESYKASKLCRVIDASGSVDDVFAACKKLFEPTVVFVLGGPGSGKGTQCERIRDNYKFTHLSAGDLLRCELARGSPDGIMIDSMIRAGQIVPVDVTLTLLKNAMAASGSSRFLIDGFPRAIDQALAYEREIGKCSMVLYFDVEDQVLTERLVARGATSGRSDDNVEAIQKRLKVYHGQSMPVIDHYSRYGLVKRIDGNAGSPDAVYQNVQKLFDNKIIFVLGGPGAGKGTICAKIVETYGYTHLSTGDLLRAEVARQSKLGVSVNDLMVEGKIVPQDVMLKLLINGMKNSGGTKFLLDGFPRSIEQAQQFEATVGMPTGILFLDLPENIMKERLLVRGVTSGRADDNEATIMKRFESFKSISYPVLDFYKDSGLIKRVSAIPAPSIVFNDAKSIFSSTIYFVVGCAGSGRGTLAKNMGKDHGYCRIRVTEILDEAAAKDTADGEAIRNAIREKKTVPLKYTINIIKAAILNANNNKFLIDGYPRVVNDGYPLVHDQVVAFEENIGNVGGLIYLETDKEARIKRVHDKKAAEESDETFKREKVPVVRYFESIKKCHKIDGNQKSEHVYHEVLSKLK